MVQGRVSGHFDTKSFRYKVISIQSHFDTKSFQYKVVSIQVEVDLLHM